MSIANSPLVKTAIAGEDANWGRVVMAVGKAGEKAERDRLDIYFGPIRVAHAGLRDPDYDEAATSAYMKNQDIVITVRLGIGRRGDGLDLRSHQGICRHQRRLSLVKLTLVVAVALVDADDRVLLAQRPEGKALAGLWEFPGGKIEPGERPEEALIRELREELGIEVKAPCLAPLTFASHAYEDFHLLMPLYVCRRWEGFVQPREGQALKWVEPKALRDYPMPPADAPLIPHLVDLLGLRRAPPAGRRAPACQVFGFSPLAATSPAALASASHM